MKDHINFENYDVTSWLTNNCNTHIAQYISKSKGNQTMKFDQLIEYDMNIFVEKSYMQNVLEKFPDPYLKN